LADWFLQKSLIPKKKLIDALHISVAAVHGIDYLLTWNCSHIANAEMRTDISFACDEMGCKCPSTSRKIRAQNNQNHSPSTSEIRDDKILTAIE
jgi:hypothetical protein